jgi:hypothetical protein
MDETFSVELSPSEAAAFLVALQDESEGGYRERLMQDPRGALAEHRILISEALAANISAWPSAEEVAQVGAGTPPPFSAIGLPSCRGWGITLLAGGIASSIDGE